MKTRLQTDDFVKFKSLLNNKWIFGKIINVNKKTIKIDTGKFYHLTGSASKIKILKISQSEYFLKKLEN